ncbi:Probable beta-glucosidase I (Beta-D-glucoside glucohydrolase I) (Cellobiase I) (Gentiobiase I) [Durusdinium trenchii]|uniref:beta-glucosidase n=1 Tax=Durusdinium trenchii TaxID=1381693 RepID=A0ABP0MNY1_9DINO
MDLQTFESPTPQHQEEEALIHHHEVEELLRKLTLEEKVDILTGKTMWEAGGVPRLKLPRLRFSDGPHGARGYGLHGDKGAALAPCLSALAATFDEEILFQIGEILGQECAARGANVLLGPTVNIHRSPITGRHFECFSEDPFLTSRCAASYVKGVQRFSAACVKHFVGNDQEADRGHSNSVIGERVLHEVYLQPFEAAVRAGAQAIMPGYNRLNGQYCAENHHLLQEVLRDTWQFKGLVVSDWWANRTTTKALTAGLNVEMPGIEPRYFGGYLLEKAQQGEVTTELLDERCRPVLRTLLSFPRTGVCKAPELSKRKAVFKQAALESLVLLKNSSGALPLRGMQSLAIIGPQAAATTLQGGGSSRVHPDRSPSILDALQTALAGKGVQLMHEAGCLMGERPTKNPELEGLKRMGACHADGQPVQFHFEAKMLDVILQVASSCSQKEFFRRRCMPCLRPLGLRHTNPDEAHKSIVSMEWSNPSGEGDQVQRRGAMMLRGLCVGGLVGGACAGVAALAGGAVATCGALVCAGSALGMIGAEGLRVRHSQVLESESKSMQHAENLAAECDATVLVLGTDGFWECEGVDQPHMRLPGRQDELARRCAASASAAGKPLVVVLNVGSPKELPWLDEVGSVLLSYYGGECTGESVAACLLGECPSGRLPTTWPRCLEEASSEVARQGKFDQPGNVEYHEGLFLGYRNGELDPVFHFGHGLSYTNFEYSDLQVDLNVISATVSLQVKNVGAATGAEVIQVYITTLKVPRALKAFQRTKALQPNESVKVTFQLDERGLGSFYEGGWKSPDAGSELLLEVGASSKDVRLSQKLLL